MKYLNINIGWHKFSVLVPQGDIRLYERIKMLLPFKDSNKKNLYLIKIVTKKPNQGKEIKITDAVSLHLVNSLAYLFMKNRKHFPALYRALYIYSIFVHFKNNALILHSAGININNNGYIFSGKSGSGKTTIAKNFSQRDVLSDEAIAIKLVNGNVLMRGTPFGSICNELNHQLKVHSLSFITTGKITQVEKIPYPNSVPVLLRQIPYLEKLGTKERKKAFVIATQLCKKLKTFSLKLPRRGKIKHGKKGVRVKFPLFFIEL